MSKGKKFTTTIKRKHWQRKLKEAQEKGYFWEYKNKIDHWDKRINGLEPPCDGVFLVGKEGQRVRIIEIKEYKSSEIPQYCLEVIYTDTCYALKCEMRNMAQILLDRRMTLAECSEIWNADTKIVPLREMVFFRIIYAVRFRPDETVNCDIEDYDRAQHLITARKVKRRHNLKKGITITPPPKTRKLDLTTHKMLCKLIGNHKKGPIFATKTGRRCHYSQFKRAIHDIAETLGIQKVRYITDGGKVYYLVSLTGLREAGERHEVLDGGSELIAARCSDHTEEIQRKHYMGVDTEEIIMQQERHHPFFKEEKG